MAETRTESLKLLHLNQRVSSTNVKFSLLKRKKKRLQSLEDEAEIIRDQIEVLNDHKTNLQSHLNYQITHTSNRNRIEEQSVESVDNLLLSIKEEVDYVLRLNNNLSLQYRNVELTMVRNQNLTDFMIHYQQQYFNMMQNVSNIQSTMLQNVLNPISTYDNNLWNIIIIAGIGGLILYSVKSRNVETNESSDISSLVNRSRIVTLNIGNFYQGVIVGGLAFIFRGMIKK